MPDDLLEFQQQPVAPDSQPVVYEDATRWKALPETTQRQVQTSPSLDVTSVSDDATVGFDEVLCYCAGAEGQEREELLAALQRPGEPQELQAVPSTSQAADQCQPDDPETAAETRPDERTAPAVTEASSQCVARGAAPMAGVLISVDQETQAASRAMIQGMPDGGVMLVTPQVTLTVRGPITHQQAPW